MKRRKVLIGFAVFFFTVMIIFTFVSRNIALSGLTKVETVRQSGQVIIPRERVYEETGQEPYVQVVVTEMSILGEQYVVENVPAKIISFEDGQAVLDMDEYVYEVVISSERVVEAGERVRKE